MTWRTQRWREQELLSTVPPEASWPPPCYKPQPHPGDWVICQKGKTLSWQDLIFSKSPKSLRKSLSFLPQMSWDVQNQDQGGAITTTSTWGTGVGSAGQRRGIPSLFLWWCFSNACFPLLSAVGSFSSNFRAQTHHHIQPGPHPDSPAWKRSQASFTLVQRPIKTKFWLLYQRGSTLSSCWLKVSLPQCFLHKIFILSLSSLVSD